MSIIVPSKFRGGPSFPEDPRDGQAWDRFWHVLLEAGRREAEQRRSSLVRQMLLLCRALRGGRSGLTAISERRFPDFLYGLLRMNWSDPAYVQEVAPLFKEYGVRTILFAGNGVSMMPHAFSHYGFASVALDTSSVATNFSRRHPPSEEALLAYFCPEGQLSRSAHSREKMREAMASAYHPGGTVEFLVQDLFTYHPIEGGFQAVVMQHVAEHFSPADRSVLAARLYRWLSPGGILVVESQHHLSVLFEAADGIEEAFEAAGFLFHLKDAYLWKNEQYAKWRQQPSEVRARTQGDIADGFTERAAGLRSADFAQARRGRRLVIFRGCA